MKGQRILAALSAVCLQKKEPLLKVPRGSLADLAQQLIDVNEKELAKLQKVLAEEYGIILSEEYQFQSSPKVCLASSGKWRKEKMFVPQNIGNVQSRALGKRRK